MTALDIMAPPGKVQQANVAWTLHGFRPFVEDNGHEQWRSATAQQASVRFFWPRAERAELRLSYLPGVVPQIVTVQLNQANLQTITTSLPVTGGMYRKVDLRAGNNTLTLISRYASTNTRDPVLIKLTALELHTTSPPADLSHLPLGTAGLLLGSTAALCCGAAFLLGLWPPPGAR